ncbi:MAG TPA: AsmA family protein [Gammaproteobacteria bacterium]|nr:AsmA family protein [Gammaproteobacteria bacterium]
MRKLLKIAGIALGVLVALLVSAALIVALVFDPNDYKDEIAAVVKEKTGRELTFHGDIALSFFPWLGLELGAVELGNAPGFAAEPFARLAGMEVRVRLLPLLRREIEVGKVVIDGLELTLVREADGRTNWDDLVSGGAPAPEESAPAEPPWKSLTMGGLVLEDAAFTLTDKGASRRYAVRELGLETGALVPGMPFPLRLSFAAESTNPTLAARVGFEGMVDVRPDEALYALRNGRLTLDAQGGPLPVERLVTTVEWTTAEYSQQAGTARFEGVAATAFGARLALDATVQGLPDAIAATGRIDVPAFTPDAEALKIIAARLPAGADTRKLAPLAFRTAFNADLGRQTLTLSDLEARGFGLVVMGGVSGIQILDAPQLAGTVRIAEFSPRALLAALGQEAPQTADPTVLAKAAFEASFSFAPDAARLEQFALALDGTRVRGALAVTDFERKALRFDIELDELDADRYLPPAAPEAPDKAQEGALDAVEIPGELIRTLDVDGTLRAGRLRAFGVRMSELSLGVHAKDGLLKVNPARAKLYGGGYDGTVTVDARRGEPALATRQALRGIALGPLMADLFDAKNLSGTAELGFDLEARGRTVGDLRRTLGGKLDFAVRKGALEGMNIWQSLRESYATLKGRPAPPPPPGPPRTEFGELAGSGTIKDGVLTSKDLKAVLPFLRVTGEGSVDLVGETVDYRLRATVVDKPEFKDGMDFGELKGTTIPIHITGKFTDLKVRPELGKLVKEAAKKEAEKKLEEEKERLKKKVEDKLKELFKKK